jgi:hypothetical protein
LSNSGREFRQARFKYCNPAKARTDGGLSLRFARGMLMDSAKRKPARSELHEI